MFPLLEVLEGQFLQIIFYTLIKVQLILNFQFLLYLYQYLKALKGFKYIIELFVLVKFALNVFSIVARNLHKLYPIIMKLAWFFLFSFVFE